MRPDIDLRAFLDTRGTAILLIISALAVLAFAALGGLVQPALLPESTSDVEFTVIVLSLPLGLIIPVIAVLITAGEWSDRSIQNTLLQRPGRTGVLASKVITAVVVFTVLVAVSFALAAGTTWIGGELLGEGAIMDSFEGVMTTQLAVLVATLLFSLAMGIALQSTVLGLLAAIGLPFIITTAGQLAMAFGNETLTDVIRAVDLQTAAIALADGEATAYELLPLTLMVIIPTLVGIHRWRHREVG